MPRRAATLTQADIARAIRAAKQAGASEVVVCINGQSSVVIRFGQSTAAAEALATDEEITL